MTGERMGGETRGAGLAELWFGVFAAPAACLLNLGIGYALVDRVCLHGGKVVMHVITAACLVLALAGAFAAWHGYRKLGDEWPGEGGGPVPRSRFMAAVGGLGSLIFLSVILGHWIALYYVNPCQ